MGGILAEPLRITEVLNYFKEPWYVDWVCRVGKREANRIGKQARNIGTRVDELIKGGGVQNTKDSAEVHSCIAAYNKWKSVYNPKSVDNGTRLYNKIEGVDVCGEPDIYVDGVLVDIKCAYNISPNYWLQVNMYRWLEQKFGQVAILRLDKNSGSYEYVVKDYDSNCVDVWVGLMRAYLYSKENGDDGAKLCEAR